MIMMNIFIDVAICLLTEAYTGVLVKRFGLRLDLSHFNHLLSSGFGEWRLEIMKSSAQWALAETEIQPAFIKYSVIT